MRIINCPFCETTIDLIKDVWWEDEDPLIGTYYCTTCGFILKFRDPLTKVHNSEGDTP